MNKEHDIKVNISTLLSHCLKNPDGHGNPLQVVQITNLIEKLVEEKVKKALRLPSIPENEPPRKAPWRR